MVYGRKFKHEVTDDIVQVTQVLEGNKVQCLCDFGTKKQSYVFEVDAQNAFELEQKIKELEEMQSGGEESSEELAVFAFAPNSNFPRNFRNIRIGN